MKVVELVQAPLQILAASGGGDHVLETLALVRLSVLDLECHRILQIALWCSGGIVVRVAGFEGVRRLAHGRMSGVVRFLFEGIQIIYGPHIKTAVETERIKFDVHSNLSYYVTLLFYVKKLAKTEIFFTRAFPSSQGDRIPHLSAYIYMRDSVTLGGGKTPTKKLLDFLVKS